jgi:hypothetical protein
MRSPGPLPRDLVGDGNEVTPDRIAERKGRPRPAEQSPLLGEAGDDVRTTNVALGGAPFEAAKSAAPRSTRRRATMRGRVVDVPVQCLSVTLER